MGVNHDPEKAALLARIAELEAAQVDPLTLALIEYVPAYLMVVSPDGTLLATGRASSGFGSVVGRSIYEFSEPASHPAVRAAIAEACATGKPGFYECVAFGEDGSPGHVYHVRAVPLGAAGEVNALVLVPTDITDHVKMERALSESESALRLAVNATRMGLWRWDMAADRVEWDARLVEIWSLAEAPKTYEDYRERIHPDDRELVVAAIGEALETGRYPTFEHRIRIPGAECEERHVLCFGTVNQDASGKPTGLMGGVLDVTERKRLESQLARAGRVQAVGQLTAGIAHNFNNLLSVIIPNVETSMSASSDEARQAALSAALEAALGARDVVKSLLDLARRRPSDDESVPASPKEIVTRALAICRATFPREIAISATVDDLVGAVPLGASELEQVLLNLLFNARDALEEAKRAAGTVTVTVDRLREGDGSWVRIRVTDDGVGMTPEVKARLFEPFFTTKSPQRGSGLGLANALLRVRQAGGTLTSTSTTGEGTTFELRLPELAAPPKSAAAPAARTDARGETILLVDDERMVRASLRRLLELEGYRIVEAKSAAEARRVLGGEEGARVELIILDQSMPGESGTAALPSLAALSKAPVILYSGMVTERPAGVAAVFEKPARAEEIWRLVRDVLDAR